MDLSVIIPFVNEWPLVVTTVASVSEELRGRVNFEIIAVDNWCPEVEKQGRERDKGGDHLRSVARGQPWLTVLEYKDRLSHWQAKNLGVQRSSGKFLWFCDAHCIVSRDSLYNMFTYYKRKHRELNGTLHLPLTYQILEWRSLIYRLVAQPDNGYYHYKFDQGGYVRGSAESNGDPFAVPCMSTCGMMISRELFDELGGWPTGLGIYGGGENFMNFTLATLGKSINIFPTPPLYHHGAGRGYSQAWGDLHLNRFIANYVYGGAETLDKYKQVIKGNKKVINKLVRTAIEKGREHRELIAPKQVIKIDQWAERWPYTR